MLNSICLFKISQFFITFKHNYNCNREHNSVKMKVLKKNKKDSNDKYYQAILVSTCTILQFKVIHGTIKISTICKIKIVLVQKNPGIRRSDIAIFTTN